MHKAHNINLLNTFYTLALCSNDTAPNCNSIQEMHISVCKVECGQSEVISSFRTKLAAIKKVGPSTMHLHMLLLCPQEGCSPSRTV